MPIQRNYLFDLNRPEICALVTHNGKAIGASFKESREILQRRKAEGYEPPADWSRIIPSSRKAFQMVAYGIRRVRVSSPQGRLINIYEIQDAAPVALELWVEAILTLRQGLDPVIQDVIVKAFSTTQIDLGAVDDAETQIIRAGAKVDDYWIEFSTSVQQTAPPDIGRAMIDQFINLTGSQRDVQGRKLFMVAEESTLDVFCSSQKAPIADRDALVIKPGADADLEIRNRENANNPTCDGLVVTDLTIGTAFLIPEIMLRWDLTPIFICDKFIGSMNLPYVFKRQRPAVLHGLVASLDDARRFYETIFRDCLNVAISSTAVLQIVSGFSSIAAAAAVFKTALLLCLETKIQKSVTCIVPDLVLVVEDRNWDPA